MTTTTNRAFEGAGMKLWITTLGGVLLIAGCASEPAPAPAHSATPPGAMNMPMASPKTDMPVMTDGCPDKDATHVLMQDEPIYYSPPGQGVAPVGILKSGTKVLAMVPGSMYTKCMMGGGKSVYIKTASLKPTTN
jgi:hypothetical protein